ncbi:unnamed protein product [Rhizophagus irregularis]|nr:unnamed protein product [Rhizophagus irregularis]
MYALVLNQEFIRSSWMNDFVFLLFMKINHILNLLYKLDEYHYDLNHTYLAEQNDLILTRIDSFELFLQENVIHVHYLNGIRDKLAKPRATSTSTTDAMNSFII